MSEIYEKHKDEDGFLYMTYSGEDILCAAKTSLRIADSLTQEHPSGAILLESLPETWRPLLSTLEKLVSMSESDKEFKKRFEEILKRWTDAFCSLLICVSTKEDIPWVMKLKELTNFYVRNHLVQSLFPRVLLQIEDDVEDHQLQVVVSRTSLFKDSLNQVMAADPLFFLHLAGKKLFSWKDLIYTDKELHKKYKEMLEMDAQEFDALQGYGLTFSGLCYDNDNRQVTSSNKEEYITLIMYDRYFLRIRDQVLHFSYGVEDMIDEGVKADRFFNLLKLEDLDSMLRGSQYDVINVEDWNQYTDYVNYQRSDNVILWFWNVVSQMNQEDLHRLLCFWTSHRFLPRDGFQGLPRLSILRMDTSKKSKNLYKPKSQTCCYSLHFPDYDTYEDTEQAIMWITQEYSGFGEA
ncbi:Autophagy protein Atg8 ubiquitin-like [Arabidopsis thaliana x Arabidopsis arenosa]|uniref:Autophagy protein Atg8 ubiquitin-like n=1 Tax=Arabidopsis thaliana x Arabidopsis arenosa TaxID=1240361 RepID=A0A8T2BHK3_9BRAS|nr:Autophagy protein Atg8 ubiquitin-like [Arabidopsis thaliana x Arabidopsis arenosa]